MTQAMHQILVVEDDWHIRSVLRALFKTENYRVVEAQTAKRADVEARSHKPDLLLVDLGLPDGDGIDVIRRVRQWSPVPVIVLSARSMETEKISALDAGADDYVTKPFSAPELLARVRAALRRNAIGSELTHVIAFGPIQIDLGRRTACGDVGDIRLTPLEYRVIECLARHAGLIVTQQQLMREAWGPDCVQDTRNLRACVKNLRQKLEPDSKRPRYLVTEAGIGYRLCVESDNVGLPVRDSVR